MAAAPKITREMIKSFDGEGDLVSWLAKAKLVAKLAKITDLASFLPLYLEGDALAVYLEMSDADQASSDSIVKKLKEVFTDGPFVAYSKLSKTRWSGEPVDVYATEIRRLVALSGLKDDGAETLIKLAFVNGFPEAIRVELQQVEGIDGLKVSDLLSRARILVGNQAETVGAIAHSQSSSVRRSFGSASNKHARSQPEVAGAVAQSHVNQSSSYGGGNRGRSASGTGRGGFRGKCFNCDGPHMARNCPEKAGKSNSCYICGQEGHLSYNCPSEN